MKLKKSYYNIILIAFILVTFIASGYLIYRDYSGKSEAKTTNDKPIEVDDVEFVIDENTIVTREAARTSVLEKNNGEEYFEATARSFNGDEDELGGFTDNILSYENKNVGNIWTLLNGFGADEFHIFINSEELATDKQYDLWIKNNYDQNYLNLGQLGLENEKYVMSLASIFGYSAAPQLYVKDTNGRTYDEANTEREKLEEIGDYHMTFDISKFDYEK